MLTDLMVDLLILISHWSFSGTVGKKENRIKMKRNLQGKGKGELLRKKVSDEHDNSETKDGNWLLSVKSKCFQAIA